MKNGTIFLINTTKLSDGTTLERYCMDSEEGQPRPKNQEIDTWMAEIKQILIRNQYPKVVLEAFHAAWVRYDSRILQQIYKSLRMPPGIEKEMSELSLLMDKWKQDNGGNKGSDSKNTVTKDPPRLSQHWCEKILEMSLPASIKDIRDNYFQLAKKKHPDTGGDHQSMVDLNDAYKMAVKHYTTAKTAHSRAIHLHIAELDIKEQLS